VRAEIESNAKLNQGSGNRADWEIAIGDGISAWSCVRVRGFFEEESA